MTVPLSLTICLPLVEMGEKIKMAWMDEFNQVMPWHVLAFFIEVEHVQLYMYVFWALQVSIQYVAWPWTSKEWRSLEFLVVYLFKCFDTYIWWCLVCFYWVDQLRFLSRWARFISVNASTPTAMHILLTVNKLPVDMPNLLPNFSFSIHVCATNNPN